MFSQPEKRSPLRAGRNGGHCAVARGDRGCAARADVVMRCRQGAKAAGQERKRRLSELSQEVREAPCVIGSSFENVAFSNRKDNALLKRLDALSARFARR